jgi:hypothetical protein
LTGSLILPPANQCAGCSVDTRSISVATLNKDAGPTPVTTTTTNSQGQFSVANPALQGRTAIVVASMSQAAQMGGVEAVESGNNVKNFNVTTQIACLASVILTRGDTAGSGKVCNNPVFSTLDPSQLDDGRIANLEEASGFVQARVDLSNGSQVGAAACAVINCTNEGAQSTNQACMDSAF